MPLRICGHVPLLDNLLAPFRAAPAGHPRAPAPQLALAGPTGPALPARQKVTSQIPPNTGPAPIRSIG